MRISFHHANPEYGNESFLLRFDTGADETPCVLVDAGHGVDLDTLLKPTDRLAAICLTHAHLDHYSELAAAHRHNAPVLTSSATAALLDDVFDVAGHEYDVETTHAVTEAVTPIDDWTEVAPGIDVHTVPAGHVPGAVGFLLRATEDEESHHLLVTGDFTHRRAGGFPGFDAGGFVDVDALFLTGATNDEFETSLTAALGTALAHAHGGAPTLVTTSGLVGPQIAYLLSAVAAEHDLRVPVRIVGHAAKLYEALDYDCPGVEAVPEFQHTRECLGQGVVTIAGPEIPRERSSGRLFGVLREDPNACVIQLVGSGESPLSDTKCTIHDYEFVNHPTREMLVDVHDAIEPTQTIVTHRHGGAQGEFNDLSSVVWGAGDTDEYTLYDDSHWQLPPWMHGRTISQERGRSVQQFAGADLLASFPVPSLDRHDEPDLVAEGVDVDRIASLLHQGPNAASSLDAPTPDDQPDDESPEPETEPPTVTADSPDQTPNDERKAPRPTDLVRTTNPDLGDEIDPDVERVLQEQGLTPEDVTAMLAYREQLGDEPVVERDDVDEAETDRTNEETNTGDTESEEGEPPRESPVEQEDDDGVPAGTERDAEIEETLAEESIASNPETTSHEEARGATTASDGSGVEVDHDEAREQDGGTASTARRSAELASEEADAEDVLSLELNPLAVALAERQVLAREDERAFASVDALIVEAVDEYVIALLAGEASGGEDEQFSVDLGGSDVVERALVDVVEGDDRFESTADLVAEALASLLGPDATSTVDIRGLSDRRDRLDAVVQNEVFAHDDREAVVESAVARFVAKR